MHNSHLSLVASLALLLSAPANASGSDEHVLVETEAFDSHGGWVLDQQFMDLMGSPFLLAHGMGTPVADASTLVEVTSPGDYRVWVRTRDWVAPWGVDGAPGRFQLAINGDSLPVTFGTEGVAWHWQDGGVVALASDNEFVLHDLTGFEGRCDAILLSSDLSFTPPDGGDELSVLRRSLQGLPVEPEDGGAYDLVVVGGGVAGVSAAVSAARSGLTVALIHDRPVLGGNSSSEVRVWPEGHVNQPPYPRVGDVVMELVPERGKHSANGQDAVVFDDDRKMRVVIEEPNIRLFAGQRMNGAFARDGLIQSVDCENTRTAERTRITGRWFLDSTGDASLGFLAGADFEQTDTGHMGASNLWNIQCLCEDEDPLSFQLNAAAEKASFPRVPWAVDLADKPFPGRDWGAKEPEGGASPITLGNWYWENGFDRDPIHEMERIRDQNFRAMYGAWDAIKNVEGRYPAHKLNWVAYIAGKRESRRLMGDLVLTGEDLRDGVEFVDGVVPCTWGIDTHHPDGRYSEGHDGDEFIADYTHGEGYVYQGPYWVPYRCLYSRNIRNLFMAGRDISVTHEALGAVRVMKTTGAMGEIVGMAAAICKENDCQPREVYSRHLDQLKERMEKGLGKQTVHVADADDPLKLLARTASIRGTQLRFESERNALGYWRTSSDFAEWTVQIEEAGKFHLDLEYACTADESGGAFEVRVDSLESAVGGSVVGTGDWSTYQRERCGSIALERGVHAISIHSLKTEGPLMKLRALELTPAE